MLTDPTKIYRDTRATSSVPGASPHQLIEILLDATLEKIAETKGAMLRRDIKTKAESLKRAIDIIVHLQASLDFEKDWIDCRSARRPLRFLHKIA